MPLYLLPFKNFAKWSVEFLLSFFTRFCIFQSPEKNWAGFPWHKRWRDTRKTAPPARSILIMRRKKTRRRRDGERRKRASAKTRCKSSIAATCPFNRARIPSSPLMGISMRGRPLLVSWLKKTLYMAIGLTGILASMRRSRVLLWSKPFLPEYMIQQKRLIAKKLKDYERHKGKEEEERQRLLQEKKEEKVGISSSMIFRCVLASL